MCVKSISNEEKTDLKELFENYNDSYDEDFTWDEPVGKEIW